MKYSVTLTRSAQRDVMSLDDAMYDRVSSAVDNLEENPRPRSAKKLRGQMCAWRLRVGDFRILYEVDDKRGEVSVYRVQHRRDVYR